jgi:PST family polysaccharide transporter
MNFIKTSFYSGISTTVSLITKLITNKIVAVYLSTDGMYILGQLKDFLNITNVFSNFGTVNGTIKYTAEYKDDQTSLKSILGTSFKIHLYFSIVVFLILLIFNKQISIYLFDDEIYKTYLIILGFSIISVSVQSLFLSILNGLKKVKLYVLINVIATIIGALILVALIIKYNIEGALYAFAINQFLAFLVTLIILFIYKPFKLSLLFAAFKTESFEKIGDIIKEKIAVHDLVKAQIQRQIERTRAEESTSPKNTTLYISILLESKDLINATMSLLEEYHVAYDITVRPATLPNDIDVIEED